MLSSQLLILKDDLVGIADEHLDDELLGRLARNRERGWLRLFLWHSAYVRRCSSSRNPFSHLPLSVSQSRVERRQ